VEVKVKYQGYTSTTKYKHIGGLLSKGNLLFNYLFCFDVIYRRLKTLITALHKLYPYLLRYIHTVVQNVHIPSAINAIIEDNFQRNYK